MKKIFTAVTFGLVLGIAQMAFSATLVDVPSGHWAEDAVQKLVDMGLVKGYPDGTYKGDRQLTRYEYAMVVERMVAMLDDTYCKKDGECASQISQDQLMEVKDIVEKLAAEFKDELAALKVKVDENTEKISALEEDVKASRIGNITITGSVRQRIDILATDKTSGTFYNGFYGPVYDPAGNVALGTTDPTAGYEMVPTLNFDGKAGDNVDFSAGFDSSIRSATMGYDQARDDEGELVINHAYADIDFSDTVRELDLLKVKSGYQQFHFGPYGMLVDNAGVTSNAAVRLDIAKDVVSITGIGALAAATGYVGGTVQGLGGTSKDPYAAVRLGLDLPWFDLGANFLANGVLDEKGWGLDLVLPLLRNTPFLNELRGEYLTVTDLDSGASPAATADDYSFVIGLDIYTNQRAGLTLSYADLPATVAYSSMDGDPFSEYGGSCPLGVDVSPTSGNCYSYESGRMLFPAGFEGLGVEGNYTAFKDVLFEGRMFIGNYAGGTLAGANMDGQDYTGFGALSISKPINDKSTFRVEYAQQGLDDVQLNRLRSELLITF